MLYIFFFFFFYEDVAVDNPSSNVTVCLLSSLLLYFSNSLCPIRLNRSDSTKAKLESRPTSKSFIIIGRTDGRREGEYSYGYNEAPDPGKGHPLSLNAAAANARLDRLLAINQRAHLSRPRSVFHVK